MLDGDSWNAIRVAHASRVLVSVSRRNNLEKFANPGRLRQHSRRVRYPEKSVPVVASLCPPRRSYNVAVSICGELPSWFPGFQIGDENKKCRMSRVSRHPAFIDVQQELNCALLRCIPLSLDVFRCRGLNDMSMDFSMGLVVDLFNRLSQAEA